MENIFIGTSGWIYNHWKKVFYPITLNRRDKLKYYAGFFNTVEINYSFYSFPKRQFFVAWGKSTPPGFIFSVKAPRYFTHIKRLKIEADTRKSLRDFLDAYSLLKEKAGPILFQFPPNFKNTQENFNRLNNFLKYILKERRKLGVAFEFRNSTWFKKKSLQFIKKI
jgi:uncharacterized protein YecE (DUF72 family)